jgi:hypothetical protein
MMQYNYEAQEGDELYTSIESRMDNERLVRQAITDKWLELWSLYKTRPIKVKDTEGWKSKLNDGRVFELVETVGAYIRNAVFFSDTWVNLESNEPEIAELLPLVSRLFVDKLNLSNFKREFRLFINQLLLTGFSAMLPEYDQDNDCISFKCLNSYDVFIESTRRYDQRFSYSFRDVYLNKAEFFCWVDCGKIELPSDISDAEEAWEEWATKETYRDAALYNLRDIVELSETLNVYVKEYHCAESGSLYRIINATEVYHEEVDCCPWLICTLFETPEDSYPLSLIDSSIGLILANNILHNRRLDNIALSIDNMWLFVDDGVTNPEDIQTAPGKILQVGNKDSLQPLRPPANNFNVTYQEGTVLDQKIDRNIGTGAMISANTYRQGERVTKAEIEGVKDAGGNRLTDLFEHVEQEAIMPLLRCAYKILAENFSKKEVVKLESTIPGVWDFYEVYPKDLTKNYAIRLVGTQSVINRDRNISLITDFLTLVANVPQFQPMIDYKNLYYDMLTKFGFDNPSRYLLKQEEGAEQPAEPQSALQQMGAKAQEIGGATMGQAFESNVAQGQAVPMVSDLQGINPQSSIDMGQQDQDLAMQALSTPI